MSAMILILNAGSSSVKFELFTMNGDQFSRCAEGQIESIGTAPRFVAKDSSGQILHEARWEPSPSKDHQIALETLREWLRSHFVGDHLQAVGHRVVHGGTQFSAPVVITEEVLQSLERFIPLAPLHQPHNLAGIRAVFQSLPNVPQVACFDTAFHRSKPLVAEQFAIPLSYFDTGVRRYGFHGLSYEYIVRRLPEVAPSIASGRVIVAHLGNGVSMCAIQDGHSIDTTMSFTGLDGLPMGTRCGAIDPGVLLYLIQVCGMDGTAIEDLLYKRSGLLGLSGISNDMRVLQASDDPRAAQAIDHFIYRIGRELGSLVAALGGLDGLVFTAGIGENSAFIRERVCRTAAWLGIKLDPAANQRHGPCISTADSPISAWVIPTDEEWMIAWHTLQALY